MGWWFGQAYIDKKHPSKRRTFFLRIPTLSSRTDSDAKPGADTSFAESGPGRQNKTNLFEY